MRGDEVRFAVEAIVVRGTHYSSTRTIVAESRLEAGRAYTENELRDAVARVNRLPFVIHAEPSLEKGSQRGQYVVVITIQETKPFFVNYAWAKEDDDGFRIESQDATAGFRFFAGSSGMATVSTGYSGCATPGGTCFSQFTDVTATYTQYDLFNTRASATALVQFDNQDFSADPFATGSTDFTVYDRTIIVLSAAVPLFGNNVLRASYRRRTVPLYVVAQPQPLVLREIKSHPTTAQMAWLYDTTDDPLFPTRGTLFSASADWQRSLGRVRGAPARTRALIVPGGDVVYRKFWDVGGGQSLTIGGEASRRRSDNEVVLRGGYSASLWGRDSTLRFGDLRVSATVEHHFMRFTTSKVQTGRNAATLGVGYRSEWGVIGAAFSYQRRRGSY